MTDVLRGDSFRCADGRTLRLLLIEARDTEEDELTAKARDGLRELLPPGTRVRLEFDRDRSDGYGTTLAYAYLPDGRMLNEEIARAGWVTLSIYPPNVKHSDRIRKAARAARAARKGMWATATTCAPADRRRGLCF